MQYLSLTNTAFALGQTFTRYLAPIVNSPKRIGLKKVFNTLHAELERRIKKVTLKSTPFILHFEPTNLCNLRCPICYTGSGKNPIPKGYLSFTNYKKVIDQLKDYLILVRLDGLGESFLNSDIFSMIEYATKNNIISAVSTNFTTFKPDDFKKVIDAGLDYLIISLDGATKETYEKVRVGARFETVLSSIKEIVKLKKSLKSKTPFIESQFIIFEESIHELEQIKKLSEELGVDRLLVKESREDNLQSMRTMLRDKLPKGKPCYWLWYVLNVAWTGELKACCTSGLVSPFSFGNIIENSILNEWNNKTMKNLRQLSIKRDKNIEKSLEGCKCLGCYKIPV